MPVDEFGEEEEDLWGDLDDSLLDQITELETQGVSNASAAAPAARPVLQQRDLFGHAVAGPSAKFGAGNSNAYAGPSSSNERVNAVVNKKWDRTAFAKSAAKRKGSTDNKGRGAATGKGKGKGKGKGRARNSFYDDDDEDADMEDEDIDENDPLFDPEEAAAPPKPMKLQPDREACKTFVYPLNKSLRKYQYDIVAKAFFTDTLVALPTGLGKTFLAAVLMYNFYRWFPQGKIIFMAPSRPLVNQQISACHGIVGIPPRDAVEMTGKDAPEKRAEEWERRRVFYCTPQTVKNDLYAGRLDPSDIICMVIDEAHRATGDYAYTEVVRFMMQKNPHFRLLALTATPGGDAGVVQNVIDALHIGHIEVRTDESLDIRQYIHTKKVDLVKISVQGEIGSIRERFGTLMDILLKQVKDVIRTNKSDPTTIHPYVFRSAFSQIKGKPYLFPIMSALGAMAQAISKLLEQSVSAFYEDLQKLKGGDGIKGRAKEVLQHPNFHSILSDTRDIVQGRAFEGHPKMVKLRELVLEHFEQARKDGTLESTRIMVFCSFREVVEEIVQRLNLSKEIRATRLVGQGTDAKGKKGLGQKEQNRILAEFKKGQHNVLVATSIGEEGLDIGELDLIICYEAPKSAIRTLQRAGRTGRARDGRVVVLMTEGIEEHNWSKANEKYKDVQNAIVSGKLFELYADCQRLVPADIRPVPNKVELVIEPFDPEQMGIGSKRAASKAKRKREETDNLDLFTAGFQKASGLKKVNAAGGSKRLQKKIDVPEEVEQFPIGDLGSPGATAREKEGLTNLKEQPTVQAAQPARARNVSFPRPLSKSASGLDNGRQRRSYSSSTRREAITKILKQGAEHVSNAKLFEKWENKLRSDLRWEDVNKWKYTDASASGEEFAGRGKDKSFLSSSFRLQEEDRQSPLSSFAVASTTAATKSTIEGADLLFSDDEAMQGNPGEAIDDSDEELPDLAAVMRNSKKAKSSEVAEPKRLERSSSPKIMTKPRRASPAMAKSKSPVDKAGMQQPQASDRLRLAPTAAEVIEIDSDEDDPSVMLLDKPAVAKPPTVTKPGSHPLQPVPTVNHQRIPPEKENSPLKTTKLDLDSDDMYEELDVDMDDLEALTASASPGPGGNADEVVPPSSPGLGVVAKVASSNTVPAAPLPLGPALTKSSSNIFADSPILPKPGMGAGKRKRVVVTSSPDKGAATEAAATKRAPPKAFKPADDSDLVLLSAPRPKGKLVKAALAGDIKQNKEKKKHSKMKLAADGCPFFDLRAENSDDPDSATDPEDDYGGPETTTDRQFVDSKDFDDPSDMSRFYRESLMSQANPRFQQEIFRPGQFKMRVDAAKRYVAPRRDEQQIELSQYSNDSFCAGDDEDILYDDKTDELPDDLTSEGR